MSRREPPQLFSYSFLDILACTVGAVVFVLLVLALQLSEPTRPSDLEATLRILQEQDPRAAAERLARVRAELTRVRQQEAALLRDAQRVQASLRERRRRTVKDLKPVRPRGTRATSKPNSWILDCRPEQVELVRFRFERIAGQADTMRNLMVDVQESVPRAKAARLMRHLKRLDPQQTIVRLLLRPKSISTFLEVRELVQREGFDVSWKPYLTDARKIPIVLSKSQLRVD